MKRTEILEEYTVEDGIITSPGRFEQEPVYAPAVEQWSLDGDGDPQYEECEEHTSGDCDCEGVWAGDVFPLGDDDHDEFPELAGFQFVTYFKNEQGFVYVVPFRDDPRGLT